MKSITTFLACLIGLCPADEPAELHPDQNQRMVQESQERIDYRARFIEMQIDPQTPSGNYLASRFAQRHHDWNKATKFLDTILEKKPEDLELKKRAMVLSMGAGHYDDAMERARQVLAEESDNALALLFIAMQQFKAKDYESAAATIAGLPVGSLSDFVVPLLDSWSKAAVGTYDIENLQHSAVHIYHAMLISDYLGKDEQVKVLLQGALGSQDMTTHDLERFADLYTYIGQAEDAFEIYVKILELDPENMSVPQKIKQVQAYLEDPDEGTLEGLFTPVTSAEDGMARTMFDMARLLYGDYSDESAKIFANIALYLQPDMANGRLMMAYIEARNGRYNKAIEYYNSIGPEDAHYFEARRRSADLLEENGRIEDALAALRDLVATHNDLESLIQIGDVYRRDEQFSKAVTVYNQAEEQLGGTIPADYWQLHYVRGIAYEQLGKWDKAEADLKKALEFQPDHPFVLNYLGYSWADQGINLKQSMDMIRRAASLRPEDGYIIDSLGWVLFRLGKHEEAVPHLERAVELLPYDPIINDHLGDSYWSVGRKREARFQWMRAKNHSEDAELTAKINDKITNGLSLVPVTQTADTLEKGVPAIKEVLE